jgi:hypothetical protein
MQISVENVVLPNKPLSNLELMEAVKCLKIPTFRGVFMRNELKMCLRKNECGILNLDDNDNLNDQYGTSTGGGTHWVCWWKKGKTKYYFDSYGLQPPTELINYLGCCDYNTKQIQKAGTVICGHLCLYVLKKLSDGESLQNIIINI